MSHTASVMLIDDSKEDAELIETILEMSHARIGSFLHCSTGDEATGFLKAAKEKRGATAAPSLVLLDLNMPGTDGRDVLRWMKGTDRIRNIPVVVMSTSQNPDDVQYCYENGASGYFVKPIDFESYKKSINVIVEYWFDVLYLPHN